MWRHLHLGSLRTALFNKLSASASKDGAFILRIEDTDQNRLVQGAEESLLRDLSWAGLSWDEGPDKGGPYGPYRQSERLPIYKKHVQELLDKGHAYRCFCSPELLESQKRELHEAGKPTFYPGTCRPIDAAESDRRAQQGEPHVVRLRADSFGRPKMRDAIYGAFQKKDLEEDFILIKADGFPTYHFANVVDDHLMKITHVIRGEEWLISTPKHLALYEAFGWQPPTFAHLGLLVNQDGTKLSKRNASVNLSFYQEEGIFPMALLSWLANLGSSFRPDTQPPRTVDDLASALTFKFTRGGIKLNMAKLDHFNAKYRDALLKNPIPSLADEEARLLHQHFTQPVLRAIHTATSEGLPASPSPSPSPSPSWPASDLALVPALRDGDASTQEAYVLKAFSSKQGGLKEARALLSQQPYLFWRVPRSVYQTSLQTFRPDARVLDALEAAVAREDGWAAAAGDGGGGDDCARVVGAVRAATEQQGVRQVELHDTLRLVGAGAHDVSSPASSKMFALLGRDEWRARLEIVRELMREE
ncbi:Glutamate--tRNA ligase [Escovopsis weberi]|uniref:Glutamate--tRNA ligase, mitochondrial n=1 Tax=Escovopsis weberi TaxID=150374 RepID=A0A0M8N5P1_ESCWE|nr:Glutamate--tRNA ligase [Escovopsis weberi]